MEIILENIIRKLLADKELEEIQFSVLEQVMPDKHTGKNH